MIVPILAGSKHYPLITFNPADVDPSITLTNGNLTAVPGANGWKNARCIGPYKSSGKAYVRVQMVGFSGSVGPIGAGFATAGTNLGLILGNDVNSVMAFVNSGPVSGWYNGGNTTPGGPSGIVVSDWIVVAFHLDTGDFWMSYQTHAGALNTSWNNGANSPAAGTGAINLAAMAGAPVLPAAGLFQLTYSTCTIDGNTIIPDSTLTGFVPWARL